MSPTDTDVLRDDVEDNEEEAPQYMCTVVSLLPFELNEDKPHMLPSTWKIPAASEDGARLGILHVSEAYHYVPNPLIEEGKPGSSIRQVTTPAEMARSICEDYNSAHVALTENGGPALFWVAGKLKQADIEKFHKKKLEAARKKMKNWFMSLCIMADSDWERNHDMRAVSDLQRAAARHLGLNKEWVEFRVEEMTRCPYCQTPVSPEASICANCKEVINTAKYGATKASFDPTALFGANS
jgi:hypothetical protein